MKKHLLLFVMAVLLMLPAALKAQDTVQIGNNDFGLAYLPTHSYYNYALSQQIYTATEIGRSGTIYSIAIRVNSGNGVRNLDIYMLHTNKTAFDGRYDWVPVTAADRVFSGYVDFPSQTWSTIELSAPFHYNGTDNLLIVVDDNSNSFYGYSYFGGYYLSSKQSIYVYGDDTDYDPANPSSYSGYTEYRKNVIQLSFAPISCHAPAITSFSNISQTSATMNWSQLGGATEWQVCMSGDEANAVTVTTNAYTFTGLTPYTNYTVKVRAICGSDTSAWSTGSFTTLPTCLFPTDLTLSNIRSKSVTLGWTEHNGANEWDIGLWYYPGGGVSHNSIITVTTNPYTIKNLVPNSHYAIEMRTHCSGNDNSPWSSQWMQFYTTDNATETLVEIGSGNSLHDSLPTNIHDKYSLSQQIYTAAEIDRSGRIYNVSLYSTDATETRDLDVYMVHTSKTNFADSQDWVSVNPADLVFSGEVTFVANDWTRIDFSVPFDYNGTDNVILVVDDNSGSQSGSRHFLGFDAPGQAISIFNNQTDYNPSNPNAYNGNTLDYKNQIQLGFIPSICLKPASFAVSNIGPNTVDLSWMELGDATAWQVCVNGDENNLIDVNSTNFNLRSLAPETSYTVKVRANCGGSEGVGPWSESLSFTTVSLDPLVEIGSSVNSHHALPTHARYNFSVSHQIYTAEEIGQAGDIYHVAFINTSSTCTRNIDIYMMHTNKTSFSSADDWDPATSADLVFSGNVEFLSNEWTTIELQNPFAYNGNDNLMLVVDDNSYSVTNFTYFSTFNTSSYQSLYRYTHGFNPDPLDSIGYGSQLMRGTERVKNHIQLGFSPIACPAPKSLTVTNIGSNSATLNWTQDGTATEWQICVNGDESNPIVADSTSHILTGLTPETNYTVKVRANCGNIDGMSVWTTEKSFTTYPCVVSNIQAVGMAGGKAMVSWEGHADSYILRYKPEGGSSWTTLTNITGLTYTITGLPVGNNIVEVAPDCAPTNFISATCSVAEVLSTANWYGYAIVSLNLANWAYKFISFSMQDPATLTTATATTAAYYYAAAYANGYVWAIDDYSNLYRAVLDNSNRTISDFVTVVYSIDTETVRSMSYNPIDHKMYYITENSLKNFHPDSPESVSKIGDLAHPLQTLAINSSGVAYGVERNTGDLYQVNLTDATLTLVGHTGRNCNYVQGMAFDQTTGELFWAQIYSASDVGLYKVDPTTANTSFLGQIGGSGAELTGLFMGDDNQPSCIAPVKTTISEVGPYSAKVSWTGPTNGNAWEYQYSTSPDFSTNTVSCFVNNPHVQLTSLTSETTYYVRVRTSCGSTEVSYWDATKTFTTTVPCPAPYDLTTSDITDNSVHIGWTGFGEDYIVEYRKRNILFFDDFGNDLSQWTLIDADGDGYNWHTLGTTSGGKVAVSESFVNGPGALTPDNWLVSPQMELGDMVSFWAKGVASWAGEHFAIFVSTTGTNPSDFTQVSEEFVTTTSYKKYTADLSAFTGQQGYVAIRHFNVTDIYYLIVGNFTVWNSEPWQTASTGTDSIILHGLYPETYYEVRVQSNCGSDGISGWGVPLFFTTDSLSCTTPTNFTVANLTQSTATLTWESTDTNFNIEYKKTTDTQWQEMTTTTNTVTISGLDPVAYEARVKTVCDPGVSESEWDTVTFSIVDIQSSANWYAYTFISMDHPEWERKFISFSMQGLNTVDTASGTLYDYPIAITYANGYVWGCFYDYNTSNINLCRAPLHNDTKTIGNFAVVKENFEIDYIPSMAYNPMDGKIYYLRSDQKLLSFDPSNPNIVTEVGNYTEDFEKIAINGSGEAFCFDYYTEDLYRISLTDATTTLVGSTPGIVSIAFDQTTDELFCTKYVDTGEMLYLMDPVTTQLQEIGFVGGDTTMMIHTMFMVGNTANICYAPENLTISPIGMHRATLHWDANSNDDSWIVEYSTAPDFTGATSVTVSTNSCQLSGLNAGTNYYVRVKNDCGANGTSSWTNSSFHTEICPVADQCAITYGLGDVWGDSWNGCAINVVDVATDIVIGTLTMTTDDGDTLTGTLPVCDGREIRFEWVKGYYADETSYTIYNPEGDTLFSGSDTLITPVTYTVNCPANPNIVEIGTCNGGGNNLPSDSSSNYSFSQQIYTAAEINRTGTISGISFFNEGATQTRNYDMYLVHTNKAAFSHNLDWVSVTPADLVFSGPIELTDGAWTEIALDVPFAYNGTDNILLVMNDKTGNSAPGMSCHTFHTMEIQAIYGHQDGSSYDPMFPNSILGDYNHEKNCVRLNFGTNCTKPANLSVSENGMNSAKLVWDSTNNANTWIVEYSTADDFSGSTTTTVNTNSYILTGLTPETEYHVRVKADCGADGESYWNVISFFTNSCPIENQCEITYELGDTYGDGWTGNAINVVDVTSNIVLDTWTIDYGDSASGSLSVCNGREIRFEWVSGYLPNDISYRVYDANGLQILNGVGAFLTPVTYMVNCASSPCPTPNNIAVSNFSGGTVTVSWTENGSATSWQICLDGDEANPISVTTNPYTLSGLDSTVFHNVKVRANCGSDYSFWSSPASFAQVQSTSNWYTYVQYCPNNTNLPNKFASFSAQDPAAASAASNIIPNVLAATYVNGEVWFCEDDYTNLYKAPLDNDNKTIGAHDTVVTNLDPNCHIASMSYNPVDGRIYYILYTSTNAVKLKSFNPSNLNDITEIGTFNNYAFSIAIDNNGNAYCTDVMTGSLCQVNLTNAVTTPVGDLGFSSTMPCIAFDMNTGELLMGQLTSSGDNGIYLVNPATAEKQFVGYIGGGTGATISGLFMVSAAPVVTCPAPTNLTASNITHNGVDLSWTENGSATGWQVCINGNETSPIDVYTNPYTLSGLSSTTTYTVKVRANCGADGTSDWSNEVSFTTDIEPLPPYFYITGDDSICPNQTTNLTVNTNLGDTYLWSTSETSATITVPVGTYYVTVSNNGNEVAHGNFTVGAKETYNITLNDTICEAELPYLWNSITFNAAGDTTLTLTAANGCDSVVNMTLVVNKPYIVNLNDTVCEAELPYPWNGVTFNAAGDTTLTLTATNGCDSVVNMTLVVNEPYKVNLTETVCETELPYQWNGVTFNTAGDTTLTLTAANGCDSVVNMTLVVNESYVVNLTETICETELPYPWNSITFNAAGDTTLTLTAANGCDSVVNMTLVVNEAYEVNLTETVCQAALPYQWNGVTFNAAGDTTLTLTAANGCDSIVNMTLVVNEAYEVNLTETICETALPYPWNGITFNAAGDTTLTLTAANGCDSLVNMTLVVNEAYEVNLTKTICETELPYLWNGITFNAAGDTTLTLTAANGCDSVVNMTLVVNEAYEVDLTKTICEAALPYPWNGITFNAAGDTTLTLTAANGCDSLVSMTLVVNEAYEVNLTETVCETALPYPWNGITFNAAGDTTLTLTAANGCDSLVNMTLVVNEAYEVNLTETVCETALPYSWNGITFNAAGDTTLTLTAANGCDSVVNMTLVVNEAYEVNLTETICEAALPYPWNGITFNTAGDTTVTLTAANGCDSVMNMTLVVTEAYEVNLTETICETALPYPWNGITFNAAGDTTVTLTAANGCDSVVNMTLVVTEAYEVNLTETICETALPYPWNGITFNAAGDTTITLTAANGCDSLVNMTLVVNEAHEVNLTETVCEAALPYTWNNVVFDSAGTHSVTLLAANGCDSVVNMTLILSPAYHVNETRSICPNELPYTWNNFTFGIGGTQTITLTSSAGCDSVVTMTLILNSVYNVSETRSICQNELPYTWNNFTFGTGGTQAVTLTSSAGCDSVVTMTLVVNTPVSTDLQVAACDSYEWNGETYTETGDHTLTFTAANGCDSVVTLHLTINHAVSSEISVETYDSCYTWNDQVYCVSGDYEQTLTAANGCDSVVTLHLTILVGIDNYDFAASMTVYPNPTTGILNVQITNFNTPISEFLTYDVYGKLVDKIRTQYDIATETTQIDMSQLSNGIYFVKAVADGKVVAVRKVVKQ